MTKRLILAAAMMLSVSGCAIDRGDVAYVSDATEVIPTTRGNVQVTASTNPPGYWIFPDGTHWPMGYAPRRVPVAP